MLDPDFDYTQLLSEDEIERASEMSVEQVLMEGFHDLICIGKLHGLSDDDVDALLDQLAEDRALIRLHGGPDCR